MAQWSISEVARQVGLRPSAIRYYEEVGILPPPGRVGGQRRYDDDVLCWLAVVRRAQDAGFTLDEIRTLFFGFRRTTPLSARWKKLAQAKLAELDVQMQQIQAMKGLLERLQARCECQTVRQCGAAMLRNRPPRAAR
jgi:MerR family redox-sensitive transcriptional activator SoxR